MKLTEWIKKKIKWHKQGKNKPCEELKRRQGQQDEAESGREERNEEKSKEEPEEMPNNRRKIKGIPMIRRQQLKRAHRNQKRGHKNE